MNIKYIAYETQLNNRLKEKQFQLELVNQQINDEGIKSPRFLELITKRNSLLVDIETIKQRKFYRGKDVYMPNYLVTNINI